MKHHIFVVEDHEVMQSAIADLIELEGDLELCGSAHTASEALTKLAATPADLVLVDVSLPAMSGLELIGHLMETQPDLRCLVVSGHNEVLYAEQARRAGACGYLLKMDAATDLIPAIRSVLNGQLYFSAALQ